MQTRIQGAKLYAAGTETRLFSYQERVLNGGEGHSDTHWFSTGQAQARPTQPFTSFNTHGAA